MTTAFGFLGYTLLQVLLICTVFVALCRVCRRWLTDDLLAFCAAVLLLGALGYASFWLAFASWPVFYAAKLVLLAGLAVYCVLAASRGALRDVRFVAEPLIFTALFFLAVISVGYSGGGLDDPMLTARSRFSHLLPQDNSLPLDVAYGLRYPPIPSPLAGDWLASDRPPLQTGLFILLTLRHSILPYHVVAAFLQATYLLGAWGLLVAADVPAVPRRLTMLGACLMPTAVVNTFYTWPKILPVGYLLLVCALLFCRKPADQREDGIRGVLLGGLTALAILSHGASAFMVIGLAIGAAIVSAWPSLKTMLYGAGTLAGMYVPWMLYQKFVDPPGNRLLKLQLAGVADVDTRTFLATLADSYGTLTWHDYLGGKLANLMTLIGSWPRHLTDLAAIVVAQDASRAASARSDDFFQLLPSLHAFSLALICALGLAWLLPDAQRRIVLSLVVTVAATCAVFVLLIFPTGGTTNHVGSYAVQIVLALVAVMVPALRWPALATIFLCLQAMSVATLYAFTLPYDHALWPLMVVGAGAAVALFAYALWPRSFAPARPSRPAHS